MIFVRTLYGSSTAERGKGPPKAVEGAAALSACRMELQSAQRKRTMQIASMFKRQNRRLHQPLPPCPARFARGINAWRAGRAGAWSNLDRGVQGAPGPASQGRIAQL